MQVTFERVPGERSRTRQRCAIVSLLAALLALGCGGDDGGRAQSFVGKTSSVALYVSWTRDGDALSGSLTQAVLDTRKDAVTTKRASLTGKVSGPGVSLDIEQQFGETTRLTGTLSGDVLELEYLSGASGVTTVRMEKASADAFNAALAGLRDRAEQAKADDKTAADESTERQRVAEQVQTVLDDIAALKTATAAALDAKGAGNADLARLKRDLRTLRDHARSALAAHSLSACSSAALVQSDADALEDAVTALHRRQERAASGIAAVSDAIATLLDDYATLQAEDPNYLPEDAPPRATVSRAVRVARRKTRKLSRSKTSVLDEAKAMLEQAQRLKTRASAACRTAGA